MFEAIRRNQRVLQFLLVILIFPAFAFFGISGYDNFFSPENDVARVGEVSISSNEFEEARRSQLDSMRRMLGDQLDPAMFDTPAARAQILEGLIDQRVLANKAGESRLRVSDEAVRNAITAIPDIRDAQGNFDMEVYRRLLRAQGLTEVQFENRVRADLAMRLIPDSVTGTAFVPAAVAARLASLAGQERIVRTRHFEPEKFIADVDVDLSVVRQYYEDNQQQFRSPESASVNYLVLSQATLAALATITEAEKEAYYQKNLARYGQDEQRRASHILVPLPSGPTDEQRAAARAKAQSLLDRVRGGDSFADVARAESGDPGSAENGGDLGLFDRSTMTDAFAESAFALPLNAISDIVETEFGFHVIKVTEIRAADTKPYAEVASDIERDLRREKGRASFAEKAEGFSNAVYEQPDSLEPAAEKVGLKIQKLDDYRRFGSPDLAPDSPLSNPKVARVVFDPEFIARKMNSEAIDVGENVLVSVRVLEHKPAAVQPFESVEAQVQSVVRADEAAKLANKAGVDFLASLQTGSVANAIESLGEPTTITREARTLAPPAIKAAFAQASDGLPKYFGVDLGRSGYLVGELTEIRDVPADQLNAASQTAATAAAAAIGQISFDAWLQSVKAGAQIERRLDRLSSGSTDGGS